MTELDLTSSVPAAFRAVRPRNGALCVVHRPYRPDVCGRGDLHAAEVFIALACGCEYSYCRHALVVIYGRIKLRAAICPEHDGGLQEILVADYLA